MADQKNNKQPTQTQIRTIYSNEMSYITTKFFNTSFSLQFYRFLSKDNVGRSTYDYKNSLTTTIDWNNAYALFQTISKVVDDDTKSYNLTIDCANEAKLIFEH